MLGRNRPGLTILRKQHRPSQLDQWQHNAGLEMSCGECRNAEDGWNICLLCNDYCSRRHGPISGFGPKSGFDPLQPRLTSTDLEARPAEVRRSPKIQYEFRRNLGLTRDSPPRAGSSNLARLPTSSTRFHAIILRQLLLQCERHRG